MSPDTRPPVNLSARDLRDTRGAAKVLAERMGKDKISVDTVHLLVRHGKLRAYVFDENGTLVQREEKHSKRAGQALYFAMSDLYNVDLPRDAPGRPKKADESKINEFSEDTVNTSKTY